MLTIVKILKISCLSRENICTIFLLDKYRFYLSFSIFILQLVIEKSTFLLLFRSAPRLLCSTQIELYQKIQKRLISFNILQKRNILDCMKNIFL